MSHTKQRCKLTGKTFSPEDREKSFKDYIAAGESGGYFTPDNIDEFITAAMKGVKLVKKRNREYIFDCPASFDIETTSFYRVDEDGASAKAACMYIWMFGLNGLVMIGRSWETFETFCTVLSDRLELRGGERLLYVYVHNLAFEMAFIQKRFNWIDQFSLDLRKPVYFTTDTGISFRCSYVLSGYSLSMMGKSLQKYKVRKKDGDLDYNLIRNSRTYLTSEELQYCINDVLVVMCYIQEKIETDGNITKVLMTKTSYVRKLVRNNCLYPDGCHNSKVNPAAGRTYREYRRLMSFLVLNVPEYKQAKRAYCGGFTHGNNFLIGKTLYDVASYDFTSSYPTVLIAEKYPMGEGEDYELKDMDDLKRQLACYCCMFDVRFEGLQSTFNYEHYISRSKCWELEGETVDNGRVVEADIALTTVTEIDFEIIAKTYTWERMTIYNFRRYIKRYLPHDFVKTILELYQKKTVLKGVTSEDGSIEKEYAAAKENLNSLYGMCCTDICKPTAKYTDGRWISEDADLYEEIDKYNKSAKRVISYMWGIWCTAYARANLWSGIMHIKGDYIYSDTDSLKILNYKKHQNYFAWYNSIIVAKLDNACRYHGFDPELTRPKNSKGVEKQLGIFDFEGVSKRFKTLGAKRYLTEDDNGEPHLTVAGLSKVHAVAYLLDKYGTVDNVFKHFDDKLEIPAEYMLAGEERSATGKMTHTYIDDEYTGMITDYQGNVAEYHELSCVHLEGAAYCLSLSAEFVNYLLGVQYTSTTK